MLYYLLSSRRNCTHSDFFYVLEDLSMRLQKNVLCSGHCLPKNHIVVCIVQVSAKTCVILYDTSQLETHRLGLQFTLNCHKDLNIYLSISESNLFFGCNCKMGHSVVVAVVLSVICIIASVSCFSVSVPPVKSVCRSMQPGHDKYKPQTSDSPFLVSTDSLEVQGGNIVEGE